MPQACVAFGCYNAGKVVGITYHSFPKNEEMRRKWARAVNRKNWSPTKHSRLCSVHFREADVDRTSLATVRIREGAVPTIFAKDAPAADVVKPAHRHPPSKGLCVDRECAEATLRIRDLCLRDRDLRPSAVMAAVEGKASDLAREYIQRCKRTIRNCIQEWRSGALGDGDTASKADKRTKQVSSGPSKKRKKEAAGVPSEATSSAWSQDDSSSPTPAQTSDCGPSTSTSGRNIEEIVIKEERIKEELILEDYGNDFMEFQSPEEVEGIGYVKESAGVAQSSSSHGTEGPFETIICGTSDVKIKQEIFEDESDAFDSTLDNEPHTWAVPLSSQTPQGAMPTHLDSPNTSAKMTGHVASAPTQLYKHLTTSSMKRSQKLLKAVPALSLEKCQICVNEVFSSPSDLVEHCILKHSDASSKFLPVVDPSTKAPLIAVKTQGLHSPVTQTSASAATTSGHSAATAPSLRVANPPGQPPPHWIPPYISACDVFDGVFVSLRNIPMENRKATRDKILELVNFLSKANVDPSSVNFSVTEK